MRVISVANHKGGCGKTTTSINLGACLANLGKNVLLLDLDPQGHTTCGLGINAEERAYTLYDLFMPPSNAPLDMEDLVEEISPNLYVVPTYGNLSGVEEDLAMVPDKQYRLKRELKRILDGKIQFDYILLDCPPNLGTLTYNALEASDEIIIPIEPSFFSLHGLAKISETLHELTQRRTTPMVVHALLTLFDSRTSFAKEVYDEVKDHFQGKLFKTIIHDCVALKEAAACGKSVADYDEKSIAYQDYHNLAVEYLEREWERKLPGTRLGWHKVLQRKLGPKLVTDGTLFQVMSPKAKCVEIAGEFNNWIPEPMMRRGQEGLWQKILPFKCQDHLYKFVVDGQWQLDAYEPELSQTTQPNSGANVEYSE